MGKISDYYTAVQTVLDSISSIISEEESGKIDSKKLIGRAGSSYFEDDFIKPLIRKHEGRYQEEINKALESLGNPYTFVSVNVPDAKTEALARNVFDISIILEKDGIKLEEYINIKATVGNTADNVGSWESLNRVLYGRNAPVIKRRNQLLEKLGSQDLEEDLSDYFLWVFDKSDNNVKSLVKGSVHSMLGSSLDAFQINMSQNYPVQFNHNKNSKVDFYAHTAVSLKKGFIKKILQKGIDFHREQLKLWEEAMKNLEQQ